MHSSNCLAVLFAVGALGGPVIGERSHRSHMDFHKDKRNGPADDAMAELSRLSGGEFAAQNGGQAEVTDQVVVTTTIFENAAAPTTTSTSSSSSSSAASGGSGSQIKIEAKYGLPAVQPQGQPQPDPSPAPKDSTPAGSGDSSTYPAAPKEFKKELTGDDQDYKNLVLVHHNIHRANHSLSPLVWNDTLYDIAKNSAKSCVWGHTPEPIPYGQNIAGGNAPGNVSADITNGFYNQEIDLYQKAIGSFGQDNPNMVDFEEWGHVTQMLWRDTKSVACYTSSCAPAGADPLQCGPDGSYLKGKPCGNGGVRAFFLVCNYYPPGNYPGQYSNVPASRSSVPFVQMTGNGVTGLPASI